MLRYALVEGGVVQNIIESETQPDSQYGNWIECPYETGIGWLYDGTTFTAPPPVQTWDISRVALQNRFPVTSNGVSTKYDLMTLFLTDTAYANSLGVSGQDLIDQRALIITGNNRLGTAEYVNLQSQQTIEYITLCTNAQFPDVFRLTQIEADAILNTPAQPNELP